MFCETICPILEILNPCTGPVDDEQHAITMCSLMAAKEVQLYKSRTDICHNRLNERFTIMT